MNKVLCLVLFLGLCGCGASATSQVGIASATSQVASHRHDKNGVAWPVWGAGFWISETELITAGHIAARLQDKDHFYIHYYRNSKIIESQKVTSGEIYFYHSADLALLRVKPSAKHAVYGVCSGVNTEGPIIAIGFPKTGPKKIYGTIWMPKPDKMITVRTAAESGFSGGPIISQTKKCVAGVAWGARAGVLGYAVGVRTIKAFLKEVRGTKQYIPVSLPGAAFTSYYQEEAFMSAIVQMQLRNSKNRDNNENGDE